MKNPLPKWTWTCLIAAVCVLGSVSGFLTETKPHALRAMLHEIDPIFAQEVPRDPFTAETHPLSVTDVVYRFFNAAGLAFLNQSCALAADASEQEDRTRLRWLCNRMTSRTSEDTLGTILSHLHSSQSIARESSAPQDPPYFAFIPKFLGRAVPPQGIVLETTPCNSTISVQPTFNESSGVMTVLLDVYRPYPSVCVDDVMLTVGVEVSSPRITESGTYTVTIPITATNPAAMWDAATNGVRVFRYSNADPVVRFLDALDTLLLFLPMLTNHLDPVSAVSNVNFLSNYSLMTPYPMPRGFPHVVNVSAATDIHDGDLFAKMDLNGLGPIEAFAQGTTSGHTAFAIRNVSSGLLFVCESVAQGITCTEYYSWIEEMQAAGSNIVMAPLDPSLRAVFNNTAAWEHVNRFLGNEYGYFNFFFGWVDTEEHNFPCFPWEWNRCLSSDLVEYVALFLDAVVPEVANVFFGQALNHRAATGSLQTGILDLVYFAAQRRPGASFKTLMTIPEQDGWLYNSTKRGVPGRQLLPSQVCSSFACSTLQAAGVFDASIEGNITCTEMDVWDMFSLKIFDTNRMGSGRPTACMTADPDNSLCQLSGTWTFHLVEDANTRPVAPQMSHNCASRNPVPYDRQGC